MKRATLVTLTLALVSALAVACGSGDSPETAAQEWAHAFADLDGNKIAERTCAAQQANVQQAGLWASVFSIFGQQTVGQESKTDTSDLKFTKVSSSGDTARVRVTGQIRVSVLALSQTHQVDETWDMVREDGKWKWCGGSLVSNVSSTPSPLPTTTSSEYGFAPIVIPTELVRINSVWLSTREDCGDRNTLSVPAYIDPVIVCVDFSDAKQPITFYIILVSPETKDFWKDPTGVAGLGSIDVTAGGSGILYEPQSEKGKEFAPGLYEVVVMVAPQGVGEKQIIYRQQFLVQ